MIKFAYYAVIPESYRSINNLGLVVLYSDKRDFSLYIPDKCFRNCSGCYTLSIKPKSKPYPFN